jgi:hypothetical protein
MRRVGAPVLTVGKKLPGRKPSSTAVANARLPALTETSRVLVVSGVGRGDIDVQSDTETLSRRLISDASAEAGRAIPAKALDAPASSAYLR